MNLARTSLTYGAALVLGALALGSIGRAQTPATPPGANKPGMARGMMADRAQMMAEMQASQKTLDTLVAAANAATGADKVDRLTAVVTELVAQHRKMGMRMMSMGGMMQMPGGPAASGNSTPPTAKPPTDDEHAAHHPQP